MVYNVNPAGIDPCHRRSRTATLIFDDLMNFDRLDRVLIVFCVLSILAAWIKRAMPLWDCPGASMCGDLHGRPSKRWGNSMSNDVEHTKHILKTKTKTSQRFQNKQRLINFCDVSFAELVVCGDGMPSQTGRDWHPLRSILESVFSYWECTPCFFNHVYPFYPFLDCRIWCSHTCRAPSVIQWRWCRGLTSRACVGRLPLCFVAAQQLDIEFSTNYGDNVCNVR